VSEQEFTAKEGEVLSMQTDKNHQIAKRVSLVGLGKVDCEGYEVKLGESLANIAKNSKCKTMGVAVPKGANTQRLIQVFSLLFLCFFTTYIYTN
jgi:hypothetical protein